MAEQLPSESQAGLVPPEVLESQAQPKCEASTAAITNLNTGIDHDTGEDTANSTVSTELPTLEGPLASSSGSKKRAHTELSSTDGPTSKKSRDSPPSPSIITGGSELTQPPSLPVCSDTTLNKETWQGFCEIESEPAYFSVILREMGVQSVTVREVFAMDPAILEMLPQPIYGIILLFNYREFGNADQATECPTNVWFANQLPAQNSCATLAMINILMNSVGVGVGEHLEQFKEFTSGFTPYQRGEALASFDFVKGIHNSFAKKMDILECDKYLSHKVHKASRVKNEKMEKNNTSKRRGTKSRRCPSVDSAATNDSAENHEENAHHYIAFVPVGNEVWKLDGLDAQPTSMGKFNGADGETWLSAVSDTIAALMAAGDDDYGVIALTQSPLRSLRQNASLNINTLQCVEARLDIVDKDWRSFVISKEELPSPQTLGVEDQLQSNPVPEAVKARIDDESMPDLLDRRNRLALELEKLAAAIAMELQSEAEEEQKATQRRYDCGPVIKKWLEMLAENRHLAENLDRFMPAGRKSGKGKGLCSDVCE